MKRIEDLTREELESIVREVHSILYNPPDKDWGADELAYIDEALIRKGIAPADRDGE